MNIFVKGFDHGFFSEQPITVQVLDEEGYLLSCNHAGAEEESETFDNYSPYGIATTDYVTLLVCDKCGDYKEITNDDCESDWIEA